MAHFPFECNPSYLERRACVACSAALVSVQWPRRCRALSTQDGVTPGHSWPGAVMTTPGFEARAREMHASDICVGLQTAVHGMIVWIADKHARRRQDLLSRSTRRRAHEIRMRRPANGYTPGLGALSRQPLCPTSPQTW